MKKSVFAAFIGLIVGLFGTYYFGYAANVNRSGITINQTKSIPIKGISNITLESSLSSVHFYASTSNQLTVHLKGRTSAKNLIFNISKDGSRAQIEIRPKQVHWFRISLTSFMFGPLEADVEVPQKVYHELSSHSQAGSIEIEHMSAAHFDLDSSAGSITAKDLIGAVTAHSSAGSLNLTNTEGKLDLTDSAGSINVQLKNITHDITAHSSAGSVRITTEKSPQALQLNLQTSAGHARVNLPKVVYTAKENDRIIGSIGSGGPVLQLESSAGSVTVTQ